MQSPYCISLSVIIKIVSNECVELFDIDSKIICSSQMLVTHCTSHVGGWGSSN